MKIKNDLQDGVSTDSRFQRKTVIISAVLGLFLGVGGTTSFFKISYNKQINNNNSINVENKKELAALQKENSDLTKKVSDLSKGIIVDDKGLNTGDLMEISPPYNAKEAYNMKIIDKNEDETVSIAGNEYTSGFILTMGYSKDSNGIALINLGGKYKTLNFEYGHVDGSSEDNTTLCIEDGNRTLENIDLINDTGLNQASVDVSGVKILKLRVMSGNGSGSYGLVNLNIE